MIRKQRNLTAEEQTLWAQVVQKVKPLKSRRKQGLSIPPKQGFLTKRIPVQQPLVLPPEWASATKDLSSSSRRLHRTRKVKIEARLDLHGFTRDQARTHLAQFLTLCQNRHYLWVLVITGKGRPKVNEDSSNQNSPQGVLQDLVPQWLEGSALQAVVSGYTLAKPQDGGSGALYIRLKRKGKIS